MTRENEQDFGIRLSEAMANAVERAAASTVRVEGRKRFPATGILIRANRVLTADHVVEREEDLQVGLPDGTVVAAALAGRDPSSDLALLRIESDSSLPTAAVAASARVGQLALALGRPGREGVQASLGIVSAVFGPARTGRGGMIERILRTDAIPYPGFSGGPLVDVSGGVLGINTSGLARGTALTIPADYAWQVAETLEQYGQIRRGYLGIRSQPTELPVAQRQALGREQTGGLLVVGVESDGPAGGAGLLVGDILTGLNGYPVADPDDLAVLLVGSLVGQTVSLDVLRGGQPLQLTVTIGERK